MSSRISKRSDTKKLDSCGGFLSSASSSSECLSVFSSSGVESRFENVYCKFLWESNFAHLFVGQIGLYTSVLQQSIKLGINLSYEHVVTVSFSHQFYLWIRARKHFEHSQIKALLHSIEVSTKIADFAPHVSNLFFAVFVSEHLHLPKNQHIRVLDTIFVVLGKIEAQCLQFVGQLRAKGQTRGKLISDWWSLLDILNWTKGFVVVRKFRLSKYHHTQQFLSISDTIISSAKSGTFNSKVEQLV